MYALARNTEAEEHVENMWIFPWLVYMLHGIPTPKALKEQNVMPES